jgi:hypothetical protein
MTVSKEQQKEQQRRLRQGDRLYKRYGQPLEKENTGKYLVITPDGKTMLGDTPLEVMQKAKEAFGPGNYLFRIGPDQAVWTIR